MSLSLIITLSPYDLPPLVAASKASVPVLHVLCGWWFATNERSRQEIVTLSIIEMEFFSSPFFALNCVLITFCLYAEQEDENVDE